MTDDNDGEFGSGSGSGCDEDDDGEDAEGADEAAAAELKRAALDGGADGPFVLSLIASGPDDADLTDADANADADAGATSDGPVVRVRLAPLALVLAEERAREDAARRLKWLDELWGYEDDAEAAAGAALAAGGTRGVDGDDGATDGGDGDGDNPGAAAARPRWGEDFGATGAGDDEADENGVGGEGGGTAAAVSTAGFGADVDDDRDATARRERARYQRSQRNAAARANLAAAERAEVAAAEELRRAKTLAAARDGRLRAVLRLRRALAGLGEAQVPQDAAVAEARDRRIAALVQLRRSVRAAAEETRVRNEARSRKLEEQRMRRAEESAALAEKGLNPHLVFRQRELDEAARRKVAALRRRVRRAEEILTRRMVADDEAYARELEARELERSILQQHARARGLPRQVQRAKEWMRTHNRTGRAALDPTGRNPVWPSDVSVAKPPTFGLGFGESRGGPRPDEIETVRDRHGKHVQLLASLVPRADRPGGGKLAGVAPGPGGSGAPGEAADVAALPTFGDDDGGALAEAKADAIRLEAEERAKREAMLKGAPAGASAVPAEEEEVRDADSAPLPSALELRGGGPGGDDEQGGAGVAIGTAAGAGGGGSSARRGVAGAAALAATRARPRDLKVAALTSRAEAAKAARLAAAHRAAVARGGWDAPVPPPPRDPSLAATMDPADPRFDPSAIYDPLSDPSFDPATQLPPVPLMGRLFRGPGFTVEPRGGLCFDDFELGKRYTKTASVVSFYLCKSVCSSLCVCLSIYLSPSFCLSLPFHPSPSLPP